MTRVRWQEISRAISTCRACQQSALLTVTESRYVRTWRHGLMGTFDAQASRTATCAACRATYPIRVTDETAQPAADRAESELLARDWDYSRTA